MKPGTRVKVTYEGFDCEAVIVAKLTDEQIGIIKATGQYHGDTDLYVVCLMKERFDGLVHVFSDTFLVKL